MNIHVPCLKVSSWVNTVRDLGHWIRVSCYLHLFSGTPRHASDYVIVFCSRCAENLQRISSSSVDQAVVDMRRDYIVYVVEDSASSCCSPRSAKPAPSQRPTTSSRLTVHFPLTASNAQDSLLQLFVYHLSLIT